jgi:predicted amidophosphoribosyltransferase
MNLTNCPHCTSPIPPEFASMPICSICGGDLSSAPAAPVWSSVDIKTDNTRVCPNCHENVKSILAMECPNCGAALAPAGKTVEDAEKEKEAFEAAVQASQAPKEAPKTCPHCTSPIPPEFAVMPICSICGGDLSSAPAAPVWSSVDIKTDNTRVCPNCHENVKSILAMECPNCGAALAPAGKSVEDAEKEKEAFEAAVQAAKGGPDPTTISNGINHEAVVTAVEEVSPDMEVEPIETELQIPESVVIHVDEDRVTEEPPTILVPEKVILSNPIMNPAAEEEIKQESTVLKSTTSEKEIKPYPERDKSEEEEFIPLREKAHQKKKEGFFARLLRLFGFGGD